MEKSFSRINKFSDSFNSVKKVVVGQDEGVRSILTSIYEGRYLDLDPNVTFVVGGSGTGKTLTFTTISRELNMPVVIWSATQITEAGYVGNDVEDMLVNLLEKSREFDSNNEVNIEIAQRGILVIDEIAKKTNKGRGPTVGRDASGEGVMNCLLPILNGDKVAVKYKNKVECFNPQTTNQNECGDKDPVNIPKVYEEKEETIMFDTRNLVIFLVDACIGMSDIRRKRCGEVIPIGFKGEKEVKDQEKGYTEDDLMEYGFINEFVGRITYDIIEYKDITLEMKRDIIKNSYESAFRKREREIAKYGITLEYYDEIFEDIALASEKYKKIGARGLIKVVNKMFAQITPLLFECGSGFTTITLLKGIIDDNIKFEVS